MNRIAINGICGRMGRALVEIITKTEGAEVAFGIDKFGSLNDNIAVFNSLSEINLKKPDVIIDFSHFSAVPELLSYCVENEIPVVICTTGLGDNEKNLIKEASLKIPVFYSANMSIGISLVKMLAQKAAQFLGDDFDIEIVERHHNQKLDAPSGTALAIADSINSAMDEKFNYVYDRHAVRAKRTKTEIGISAVRGGSIVGDHEVIFAGPNEVIEIQHHAQSRNVFADGAVRAALYLIGKPAGLYNMEKMLG